MTTFYTLAYWDLGWVLEDNKLYSDPNILIYKLLQRGFTLDYEDEDSIVYIRGGGGYGDHMNIMKLTYEEEMK